MARFWLGTWRLPQRQVATGIIAQPLAAGGAEFLALEIIHDGPHFQVLFSTVDNVDEPAQLHCCIGFCNDATACNSWLGRGFPIIDAAIDVDQGWLRISSPFFAQPGSMVYRSYLIQIHGLDLSETAPADAMLRGPVGVYHQIQQVPDPREPGTQLVQWPRQWAPERSAVVRADGGTLTISAPQTRSPSLLPLVDGPLSLHRVWRGEWDAPLEMPLPVACMSPADAASRPWVARANIFGEPVFRFRDIEVYGFRLELDNASDRDLATFIAPLNTNLVSAFCVPDGTDLGYRMVKPVLLIEMLRYGSMQLDRAQPPLEDSDYQSQHELLIRVLVAKYDDLHATARESAVYVPAIFVDNPWSKRIGRELQGFSKCMADFCVDQDLPLRPDGLTNGGASARPLADVNRIRLVSTSGLGGKATGPILLDLEHPQWELYRDKHVLRPVPSNLALSGTEHAAWLSSYYAGHEFDSPSSHDEVWRTYNGYRSVQVSPVDESMPDRCWLESVFSITNLEVESQSRIARLHFHYPNGAPAGWRRLCDLLGIREGASRQESFHAGGWYHLKYAMGLKVLDKALRTYTA